MSTFWTRVLRVRATAFDFVYVSNMSRFHLAPYFSTLFRGCLVSRSRPPGRTRSVVSLLASAALLMSGVTIGAQSGQAATAAPAALTMDSFCQNWATSPPSTSVTVTGAVGDTFTTVMSTGTAFCDSLIQSFTITGATGKVSPATGNVTAPTATTFTITGPGSFTLVPPNTFSSYTLTITVSVVAASAATPADLYQSIGLGSASACASVSRPDLDWSGVASGNWTQSWAMWPNAGKGGPVCNRVLWFDSNASRWSSAAR